MHGGAARVLREWPTSFGGSIGELSAACTLHDARDGSYIDNRRAVAGGSILAFFKQRQKSHGSKILRCKIGLERLCPLLGLALHEVLGDGFGRGPIGCSGLGKSGIVVSCNASIIDEQLDPLWFFSSQVLCKTYDVVFAGYVAWECNDVARSRVILLHHLVQSVFTSSCNVDFGTIRKQCLGNHEADSGTAACDYGGEIGYIKELGGFEVVV